MASEKAVRKGIANLRRDLEGKQIDASSEADLKQMIGVPDLDHGPFISILESMRRRNQIGRYSVGHGRTYIQV